jgi:tRNA dimethylallyltransferase
MIWSGSSRGDKFIKAIIICGPTGSGKSGLGMELATRYGGSIVSADSRQIYRRLDIGTAKPSRADRERIPHYLIDVADVREDFTAKRYAELAKEAIEHIGRANRIPIIVGGAGLYIKALTGGLFEGPEKDVRLRNELQARADHEGPEALHRELMRIDPETAEGISPKDVIRTIRALEIFKLTGKIPSRIKKEGRYLVPDAEYYWIGLDLPRDRLYERINRRVDRMIGGGLVEEIKGLMGEGLGGPITNKKIVGYYEIINALEEDTSIDEAIELVKRHSRNYAKRQITWFKNQTAPNWLDPNGNRFHDKVFCSLDEYLKRA